MTRWQIFHVDVTVSCTTVDSYLEARSRDAGAAAELAASNKVIKKPMLDSHHRVNSSGLRWCPTAQ